ncbi:MAG TPA: outer membrane beta-barrel protein [Verrucomicrobiae bacterium]|nr:outer membrane beta-barrel protein [Verrucomicrobiae bacterium]
MKTLYLSGVACLALGVGLTTAQGQTYSTLPEGAGPYLRADIGPAFFEDGKITQFGGPSSSSVKYKTGIATDVAIGYAFNKYIATDFQVGLIGAEFKNTPGYYSSNTRLYNVPFLANITLTMPIPRSLVVPYIGVGAGGAEAVFDTDNFFNGTDGVVGSESDTVFAWQAFAGLRFKLNDHMSLGVGYKYFATEDPTFSYPPDSFPVSIQGVMVHSVLFTFNLSF